MHIRKLTSGWTVALAAGLYLLASTGCAPKQKEVVWVPGPQVGWEHISTVTVDGIENGYVFLERLDSTGRFPAALAVSRLDLTLGEVGQESFVTHLPVKPKNEFLQWNSLFDDQMAISEVFPIAERDLGGGPVTPVQILAAFHALGARLGLLYATNRVSPTESEMLGIIYEASTGTPLAAIHAREASIPAPEDDELEAEKVWKYDSAGRVRTRFHDLVRQCMREMILADEPSLEDIPEGWRRKHDAYPAHWPPIPF